MQERRARTVGVRVTAAEAAELRALGQRVQRRLGAADAGVEPDRGESESNGAGAHSGPSRVAQGDARDGVGADEHVWGLEELARRRE